MSKYPHRQYLKNPKSWTELARIGTLSHFLTSIVAKHQKIEGGLKGVIKDFFSKSHNAKKLKGDPLVSPSIVCYAEKVEEPFWFTSLGQMFQFGTIKFRRTFKNYFGQFVWIEKSVTIIVAFHFVKRRLIRL